MNRKHLSAGVTLVFIMGWALAAAAQEKPEVLVKQRQAAMTLQGKYFGPLYGMTQGKIPYNAEIVTRNAAYLNVLDKMPWDGFDVGTKNVESGALPAVFTDMAKFKNAQQQLQEAVSRLVALKTGNEESVKNAISEIGKACSNCHEQFRQKK